MRMAKNGYWNEMCELYIIQTLKKMNNINDYSKSEGKCN